MTKVSNSSGFTPGSMSNSLTQFWHMWSLEFEFDFFATSGYDGVEVVVSMIFLASENVRILLHLIIKPFFQVSYSLESAV